MRTLPDKVAEIVEKRHLESILLLVITTYTNKLTAAVDDVHYFATRNLSYDYGGTGTQCQFARHIIGISPMGQSLQHLTTPGETAIAMTAGVELSMSNSERDGTDTLLYNSLQTEQLLGADIEVSELPLAKGGNPHHDTAALTGDDHTVLFRGEISWVGDVSSTFTIRAVSHPFVTQDAILVDSSADPRDLGMKANQVYGRVTSAQCHNASVGAVSTLSTAISDTTTAVGVTDTTRFPTSGDARIGHEKISWTGKTETALTTVTRGVGTTATEHNKGAFISELPASSVFAVAGHAMKSVDKVYALNPADGKRVIVSSSDYTVDLEATSSELRRPDGAAVEWTKTTISAAQMANIIDDLEGQPEYEVTESRPPTDLINIPGADFIGTGSPGINQTLSGFWSVNFDSWYIQKDFAYSGSADSSVRVYFNPGLSLDTTKIVKRWRVHLTATIINTDQEVVSVGGRLNNSPTDSEGPLSSTEVLTIEAAAWPGSGPAVAVAGGQDITPWYTPSVDTLNVDDWRLASKWSGFYVEFYQNGSVPGITDVVQVIVAMVGGVQIEFEYEDTVTTRTREITSVSRVSGGEGIRLLFDGDGYTAPDATYTVSKGGLLETYPDIVRHFLRERFGLPAAAIDETSWADAATEFEDFETSFFHAADTVAFTTIVTSGATGPDEHDEHAPQENRAARVGGTPATTFQIEGESGVAPGTRDAIVAYHSAASLPSTAIVGYVAVVDYAYVQMTTDPTGSDPSVVLFVEDVGGGGASSDVFIAAIGSSGTKHVEIEKTYAGNADDLEMDSISTWGDYHFFMTNGHFFDADLYDDTQNFTIDTTGGHFGTRFLVDIDIQIGFVESEMGATPLGALSRVLFEARSQLVRAESATATTYRWLIAEKTGDGTYEYSTNGDPLTLWREAVSNTRDVNNVYTSWKVFYDQDRALKASSQALSGEELFRSVLHADAGSSDMAGITTAEIDTVEEATGSRPHQGLALIGVTGDDLADDVAGFYVSESLRFDAERAQMGSVPWSQGYALEVGDVRMVQLSHWPAAKKLRLLGVVKDYASGLVDVQGIEVL